MGKAVEQALKKHIQFGDDVERYMQEPDSKLKQLTAVAEEETILSIRRSDRLNMKQRYILSRWIADRLE